MRLKITLAAYNVLVLGFVAFPLFFLLVWAHALVVGTPYSRQIPYVLGTGIFYYLSYFLPVIAGGAVHQLALLLIVQVTPCWVARAPHWTQRVLAILLSPLVLITAWAAGQPLDQLGPIIIPIVIFLIIYGLFFRFPFEARPKSGLS